MGWIDFVILILLGLNIWTGYNGGTVRALISVVGMIVGIEFASRNFQRFAKELAPMVHSLEAANAIWFILQIFIVLFAFNFIGHALQQEVGQMLHHDPSKEDAENEKSSRKRKKALAEAHHETNAHPAQHEQHASHPQHIQHQNAVNHATHAHPTNMSHEVISSQTEEAWTKVSPMDGVIGGLLGMVRGVVLGCAFIMATAAFFPGADTLPDALLPRYLTGTTAVLANLTSPSVHKKIIAGLEAAEPGATNQEAQPDPNAPATPDQNTTPGQDATPDSQNSPNQ